MDPIAARIKEIIEQEGISQILFAEKTRINKSTLNHVLTGRNQPSSKVIQKILSAFPHYRHEWLLSGDYPRVKEGYREEQAKLTNIPLFMDLKEAELIQTENTPPTRHTALVNSTPCPHQVTPSPSNNTRKVEKIIIYYDDNTYQTFLPQED
ncbi:helix-turn-helix domain-containing protein [Porphyromonas sp.]|uniref:helix-turn-helix domain-containing protein n=1 Tax=Porphyromonas sp. TaxID=1924944 RepID=UPI0026DC2BEF|nr:helix-turn-helix transcriptional regulator [Porphyromonas sp.]MDO4695827.1 helix-turn-helix transcriptional regulator [Porphyromonas sp.]MDO4771016.1 helix-turn-helix transcriptional regulator [Porphyromonas sp.]